MKPTAIITLLIAMLNCIPLKSNATKRYVWEGRPGLGTSWLDASGDLWTIILQSQPGDSIWVRKGTYKPSSTGDRLASFFLKEGVVLQGGFIGTEINDYQRFLDQNPTILSGDIDLAGNNDSYHIFRKYPQDPSLTAATVLDGFIITKGRADGDLNDTAKSCGGAIFMENSSPTIRNCRFDSNYCYNIGGAIYSVNGSPSFTNCNFTSNYSDGSCGVMYLKGNGEINISGCTFTDNNSPDISVLYAQDVKMTISRGIFKNNHCAFDPALAFGYSSQSTSIRHNINNCLFIDNTWSDFQTNYGQTVVSLDPITISNCNFYFSNFASGQDYKTVEVPTGDVFNCILQGADNMVRARSINSSIVQGGVSGCNQCPGGNGNVDPFFFNTSDLDGNDNVLGTSDDGMRLTAYSQGIDAGIDSTLTYNDITNAVRTGGGGIDIGAYEGAVCNVNAGNRLYVDSAVSGGSGKGDSWENAIPDLQTAIHVAKFCTGVSEIWVAKGTYKPTNTKDRTRYFTMLSGVKIYGGFGGGETLLAQRNHRKNVTMLSGNIDTTGTADSYNIIRNIDVNNIALLDGFTITAANNESAGAGGAVYNSNSSAVFSNCIIKNNSAGDAGGGGMYNYNHSSPKILNCVFANNTAVGGGGLLNATNSSPVLRNCVLVNNNSLGNGGGMSSGINSNPTLINCNIIANTATGNGAGIYNLVTASPVITNCIFWGNGGAGREIANGAASSVPVVSYSYVQGGYAPCSNCADYSISPQFMKDFNWAGADSTYGTVDDEMHLGVTSPCLNTGTNAVVVDSLDVAGQQRIQDGTVNMGAYENLYMITLGNGNWNNPSNWSLQRVPLATDHVYIKAGHVITLNDPAGVCESILIQPGAKLLIVPPGLLQAIK